MTAVTTQELTEPRIWSSVIQGLRLPLTELNVDFQQLLDCSDISEEDLAKSQGKVPLKRYLHFMEQASILADDPLLGIRLARSCGPETLGAVGFLFLSSRTLAEALSDFCTYLNLLQDTTDFRSRLGRSELTFFYQMYGVPDIDCRQDVEFSIALTSRLIRMFGGAEVQIANINFRHSPSAPPGEYDRLLKTETRFNQESNSVSVPAGMARVGGHAFDSSLSGVLKEFLDTELLRRGRIHSFLDQVRHMLLANRIAPPVTAARTANHLGVSTATLYRRLKAEGITFGKLQEEVNFEIAKNYLTDSELTVTQIAHVVGFAESASFTRAFSRWTNGVTPSRFRRQAVQTNLAGIAR
ncbi:MAG: AraC family transcriptional regulator [Woeseiaceae bacterium]